MSIWNHRSVAIVWALNLTYIEEFFSFARVLRHFVLVPCEICVVPFGHRKIAADWNDISLATSNTSLRSSRRQLDSIIVESILNRQADYISSSIRLATNAFTRRFAPSNAVAGSGLFGKYLQIEKQPVPLVQIVFLTGSYLSSQAASSQVLSTYKGLTTVFGMGTGGSP